MKEIPDRVSLVITLRGKEVYISVTERVQRVVALGMLHDAISMIDNAPHVIDPTDLTTQIAVTFLKDYPDDDTTGDSGDERTTV